MVEKWNLLSVFKKLCNKCRNFITIVEYGIIQEHHGVYVRLIDRASVKSCIYLG